MIRRRAIAYFVALTVLFGATAAFSYFKLAASGETMGEAATKFLASLSAEQRAKAAMAYDDKARVDWHFIPKPDGGARGRQSPRHERRAAEGGPCPAEGGAQRSRLRQGDARSWSSKACCTSSKKAKAAKTSATPSAISSPSMARRRSDGKWGLSVEGHHLSLNFVVDKGNVVSTTPSAFGANPAIVMNDNMPTIKKGTRVLAKEETLAFDLVASLTDGPEEGSRDRRQAAGRSSRRRRAAQAANEAAKGILAEKLTGQQRGILQSLIDEYANSFPPDVAKERLEAVEKRRPRQNPLRLGRQRQSRAKAATTASKARRSRSNSSTSSPTPPATPPTTSTASGATCGAILRFRSNSDVTLVIAPSKRYSCSELRDLRPLAACNC